MHLLRKKRVRIPLAIVLVLIVLEILARIIFRLAGTSRAALSDYYTNARELRESQLSWYTRYVEHPFLSYRRREQTPEDDAWGIRTYGSTDTSPEDTFTVMAIGASTTESPYPQHLYEYLHSQLLDTPIQVVNTGVAGWTTAEILINLELRGLEYHPDVVVLYEALNDAYPGCDTDFQADYSNYRIPIRIYPLLPFDSVPSFFDASALYVGIRHLLTQDENEKIGYGLGGVISTGYPDFANCPFQETETFRRNVISLIGITQIHHIELMLVTQAQTVQTPDSATEPRIVADARKNNDVIREVATEYPVHFLDFDRFIEPRRTELMRRDLVHFDDDGYQILAQSIGEKIIEDFFPDKAKQ